MSSMLARNGKSGERKRRNAGSGLSGSGILTSLVPAVLLSFGALSLLLAHRSLGDSSSSMMDGWEGSSSALLSALSSSSSSSSRSSGGAYFVTHPADVYTDAWYLDDHPDYDIPAVTYEDSHILALLKNDSHIPLDIRRGGEHRNETVLTNVDNHPILTHLRPVDEMATQFNPVCLRYRFPNISLFPTMAVIIPMQNERPGLLAMTVHSLLARTPPEILKEIIIIDDNGDLPEEREESDEEEIATLCSFHPKVICIHNKEKQGCAGSRLQGIRRATADVIMIVDSHIEMYSSTWAQHLLLPILENPRTVAMQTLDTIGDLDGHERKGAGSGQNFGVVSDSFLFGYVSDRFAETGGRGTERPPTRVPFETPFAPGSLFAMRRDEFWRLGGYDEGLAVWGGENTEMALKVWTCGFDGNGPPGRIVVVPCSRVGHVYRINIKKTGRWPPPLPLYVQQRYHLDKLPGRWKFKNQRCDNFTKLVVRNNMRIIHVWMGDDSDAARGYYRVAFGVNSTNPSALSPEWRYFSEEMRNDTRIRKQLAIKRQNKCKSFDWFDRNVMFKLVGRHHPWWKLMQTPIEESEETGKVSCGSHSASECGLCPSGHGELWCNDECHWCEHGAILPEGQPRRHLTERTQCLPVPTPCLNPSAIMAKHGVRRKAPMGGK